MRLLAGALLVIAALAAPARAETHRVAVVIGNNVGGGTRPPLRFAESDAEKIAEVLVDLGGVRREDLEVVRGRSLAEVRAALGRVGARVARMARAPGARVILVFYYSGHSDGIALELGRERLDFAEVRRWLDGTGAVVRLAILDSCRSGGLLGVKGGSLGSSFDVHLADNIASTGEALITSSAADESALESAEIKASFFSHHLVSGLRGAADASGDGIVTLAEAYQYAFGRTVNSTAATVVGPQHPAYDYRLSGRGDLVLTRLERPSSVIDLPAGFDRVLVVDRARQEVVVEVGPMAARRVAVRAGAYVLRAWRGGETFAAEVAAPPAGMRRVAVADFSAAPVSRTREKGGADDVVVSRSPGAAPAPAERPWRLQVGLGAQLGISDGWATQLAALRVGLGVGGGWTVALTGATGTGQGFREADAGMRAGRQWRWGGRVRLALGGELGVGAAWQMVDTGRRLWASTGTAAATVAGEWVLRGGPTLIVTADLPVTLLRRDGEVGPVFTPGLWFGVWL